MTDRETMQQALEALESGLAFDAHSTVLKNLRTALAQPEQKPMHPELRKMWEDYFDKCFRTQPEQEPVAIDWQRGSVPLGGNSCSVVSRETIPFEFRQPAAQPEPDLIPQDKLFVCGQMGANITRVTAQSEQVDCPRCGHVCSQRPWVGLTDDEIDSCWYQSGGVTPGFARTVEAKLKEKND